MQNHAFMFSVTLYHPVRPYKHNFSLALYQQCAYAQAPVVPLMISKLQTCKNQRAQKRGLNAEAHQQACHSDNGAKPLCRVDLTSTFFSLALYQQCAYAHCPFDHHTGPIGSRSFQNYAFKGWLFLETMKLWLLVLTKTLFLMTLIIKLTLGNIFIEVKNPPGGATVTK